MFFIRVWIVKFFIRAISVVKIFFILNLDVFIDLFVVVLIFVCIVLFVGSEVVVEFFIDLLDVNFKFVGIINFVFLFIFGIVSTKILVFSVSDKLEFSFNILFPLLVGFLNLFHSFRAGVFLDLFSKEGQESNITLSNFSSKFSRSGSFFFWFVSDEFK